MEKSIDDIELEIELINSKGNELNNWFQSLSEDERQIKYGYGSTKAKMLMYRKQSLNDILSLKEKNLTPMMEKNGLIKKLGNLLK